MSTPTITGEAPSLSQQIQYAERAQASLGQIITANETSIASLRQAGVGGELIGELEKAQELLVAAGPHLSNFYDGLVAQRPIGDAMNAVGAPNVADSSAYYTQD